MNRKEIMIAGAISTMLYFVLPEMSRMDMLSVIAAVFIGVWVVAMPIEDLRKRRQETNSNCIRMRNVKPAFHGIGTPDWPMVELTEEEVKAL